MPIVGTQGELRLYHPRRPAVNHRHQIVSREMLAREVWKEARSI